MTHSYITVRIHPQELQRLDILIQQLAQSGMQIGDIQTATGTVTGLLDADRLENIRRIAGVSSVTSTQGQMYAPPITSQMHRIVSPKQSAEATLLSRDPDAEQQVSVTISVAEEYLGHYDDVVAQCEEVGLQVEQKLDLLGVVTGSIDPIHIADLQRIEGVAAVERSHGYQIAPPDSPVQ